MCLAIPGRIVEMLDQQLDLALAEVGGVRRNINVALVNGDGEQIAVGDWVLIHTGVALSRIEEAEAQAVLQVLEEVGEAFRQEQGEPPPEFAAFGDWPGHGAA